MCICQGIVSTEYEKRLIVLENIRNQCPALKLLLIPDTIWNQFKGFETSKRDKALHASHVIVALLDGTLHKLTTPVHKFLLDGDKLKDNLGKQYRKDLQQRWMFENTEQERHKKAKIFEGRIVELQIANWLEALGWKITGLEALGANTDIECIRPIGLKSAVEVKYIGQGDEEFEQVVNAIQGKPSGGLGRDSDACNYLILRAYEAAKQIKNTGHRRIAVIVVDSSAHIFLKIPLENNFINWEEPSFLNASNDWGKWLVRFKEEKKDSTVETNLAPTIKTLHELWLVVKGNDYVYHLQGHYLFTGDEITQAAVN